MMMVMMMMMDWNNDVERWVSTSYIDMSLLSDGYESITAVE